MRRAGLTHLAAALIKRERSRRRATRVAFASLLLLGTSPVIAHHVTRGGLDLLAGLDHLGTLCLTALHLLLAPVHHGFHVLLLAGLSYAAWDRLRAWRHTRQALVPLAASRAEPGGPFWEAAVAAGLDPCLLRVVEGLPVPALTAGLMWPLVYVGRDLTEALTEAELAAVLAHERAHVVRRDPLKLFVLRLLACTLFWVPVLRRLADDVADEVEITADDRAASGHRPLALATALLTLAQRGSAAPLPGASLGFHRRGLLDRRVRRLIGEDVPVQSHVTRNSVLEGFAAVALVWSSSFVIVHPMPAAKTLASRPHCEHPAESALAHLFCLRGVSATTHCPHTTAVPPHAHPLP
ncbi:MAG: M56 family metallopeptidase [Gemmatimonadales bacterium]|nr:M56 family metallopeptidase [Gemmatimonadales bacterium]